MKKIAYTTLSIIAILLIGYLVVLNLPKATTKNKEASIHISASELFSEFANHETKANQKYNGKIIEVSGKIRSLTQDKKGDSVVILETEDMIGGVLCTFENKPSDELKKGNEVKIKGQCSGLLMDVVLNKCNLIN